MFSQTARHLLLRCAPTVKVKVPARAHSTFHHRTVIGRNMYTRPFPELSVDGRVKGYFLDTRAGVGELLYQVEILNARQKRQEILLWICFASCSAFATMFVYLVLDDELDPPVKEVKQRREEK
ncbi:hypothetical protein DFP73DRAFT_633039 [Morchella snyderi]|nr:hypothetical protein DFP73DRAFT_633039 [Morchella snyderi]